MESWTLSTPHTLIMGIHMLSALGGPGGGNPNHSVLGRHCGGDPGGRASALVLARAGARCAPGATDGGADTRRVACSRVQQRLVRCVASPRAAGGW